MQCASYMGHIQRGQLVASTQGSQLITPNTKKSGGSTVASSGSGLLQSRLAEPHKGWVGWSVTGRQVAGYILSLCSFALGALKIRLGEVQHLRCKEERCGGGLEAMWIASASCTHWGVPTHFSGASVPAGGQVQVNSQQVQRV